MRYARMLVGAVLFLTVAAWSNGGEVEGPYMLIYRAQQTMTWTTSGTVIGGRICVNGYNCYDDKEIQIEYFPTLEKALAKLNGRAFEVHMNGGAGFGVDALPIIKKDDIIGLFKARRIDLELAPTGKKTKVERQVPETFEVPVQGWDVKP